MMPCSIAAGVQYVVPPREIFSLFPSRFVRMWPSFLIFLRAFSTFQQLRARTRYFLLRTRAY